MSLLWLLDNPLGLVLGTQDSDYHKEGERNENRILMPKWEVWDSDGPGHGGDRGHPFMTPLRCTIISTIIVEKNIIVILLLLILSLKGPPT